MASKILQKYFYFAEAQTLVKRSEQELLRSTKEYMLHNLHKYYHGQVA